MTIEYAEIQKYNSDLHFKSIKESINNQIIEMKKQKSCATIFKVSYIFSNDCRR